MKKKQFKSIIFETICDYYQRKYREALLLEDRDKNSNMVFAESETELPTSMEIMLSRFPTLRHGLQRLMTDQYSEFISGIDWISPKPTQFRVNLKNGQNFTLKWMGKDFEACISGKRYYLGQLVDFQQALNKLSILYTEGPMGENPEQSDNESKEESESPKFTEGEGLTFPKGDVSDMGGEGAPAPKAGNEEGREEPKNMADQEIDFETDTSI